jgi:tRNA uridine 5-carboxymethylaminomethyl modification enzyme
MTQTTPITHDIIRRNLHLSPMYAGTIEGIGPRYCPSIEDKVVRFAEKSSHQLFLEPEGRDSDEFYVNGVSTSLPYSVQYDFIRSVPGLESAEILRPGYAVEYDFCPPTQLHPTLETKTHPGLFFAGQINGTSGYEEAAAQGLIAGINAAASLQGRDPFILDRSEAYIGVLIDDLVTQGTPEPYRMFTSRAEHRLLLRHDNADRRLSAKGAAYGLLSPERSLAFDRKSSDCEKLAAILPKTRFDGLALEIWLKRPENDWRHLPADLRKPFAPDVWATVQNDTKYAGYLKRQRDQIDRSARRENDTIPPGFAYNAISGLRREAVEKLTSIQPRSLGQASRMSGVTPADLSLLSIWLERERRRVAS